MIVINRKTTLSQTQTTRWTDMRLSRFIDSRMAHIKIESEPQLTLQQYPNQPHSFQKRACFAKKQTHIWVRPQSISCIKRDGCVNIDGKINCKQNLVLRASPARTPIYLSKLSPEKSDCQLLVCYLAISYLNMYMYSNQIKSTEPNTSKCLAH